MRVTMAALCCWVAVGCGGVKGPAVVDGGPAPEGAFTPEAACDKLALAVCSRDLACGATVIPTAFGTMATCEARQKIGCLNSLQAPGTSATPERLSACAEALPQVSCADFFDDRHLLSSSGTACARLPGALVTGETCHFSTQCQAGSCWYAQQTNACGSCQAPKVAGDRCGGNCGPGLYCENGLCAAPVAQGAACDRNHGCDVNLTCVGATTTAMGTCQASIAVAGAPCDPTAQTGPVCAHNAGLYCNQTSRTCAAITYVLPGQSCSTFNGLYCQGHCAVPQGATTGTCEARALDGQVCDVTRGPFCLWPASCVSTTAGATSGTCQLAATCG